MIRRPRIKRWIFGNEERIGSEAMLNCDKRRIFATCRIGDPAENRLRERPGGYTAAVRTG